MTLQLFSLEGKTALVTGGNGGLGRGMALGLRAAGARVAVTGRNLNKNLVVAQEFGVDAVFQLEVRDEEAVKAVVAQVAERFGRLDILINNAGTAGGGSALSMSRENWEATLGVHLTGAFLCAKHTAQMMVAQGHGGKIINIGSIYSLFGTPNFADYGTAKAGILGLTRALAIEFAIHNIQVNAILPGWYETGMTRGMPDTLLGEQIRRKTPSGRWGDPDDLVGATIFLASPASDWVTGVCIPVDGGYSVTERLVRG
jgi:2-deoxy-D-gluconate 3-dehydrogenase